MDNESLPHTLTGADQLIFKVDAAAEIDRPGQLGDEIVGTSLDQESVAVHGLNNTAELVARFEQRDTNLRINFHQAMRSGQTTYPTADHGDLSTYSKIFVHVVRRCRFEAMFRAHRLPARVFGGINGRIQGAPL